MADAPPGVIPLAQSTPQPPPGVIPLAAAKPRPPPGVVPVERQSPTITDNYRQFPEGDSRNKPAALTITDAITAPFKTGARSLADEIAKESNQQVSAIKGDFSAPVLSHDKVTKQPGPPGFMDYAARAGTAAIDVLGAPLVGPRSVLRQTLGEGARKVTGGYLDPDTVTDVAMIAYPLSKTKMASGAMSAIGDGMKAVEKLFSPTTVSDASKATERIIRRAGGESGLMNEKAADRLMEHNKLLANMPVPQQRAIVSAMENGITPSDPKLAAAVKDMREVYDGWKDRVQKVLPANAVPHFIQDYYAHIWKEKPSVVGEKLGSASKQGSGRSFKQRTLPTIEDGIKAGLTPKFENPIETTMAYSQNMSRYVATHDMLKELKTQGYAKWYGPGSKNIPKGWVPLDGIMTKKTTTIPASATTVARGRPIQLYAPPDVARVFNNYISKGLEQGDIAPFYQAARTAANGMTQLKLGLSTYHLATMANESMIHDYARAFRAASKGELKTAGKALVSAPVSPVKSYMRGMKMQRELLDKAVPDSTSKVVNDAFVRSGGQLRMDTFYRMKSSGSFFNAIEKGTFKREVKEAAGKIYKGTAWENAKGVADMVANVIQTTAAPLFEKYIPAVKRGAFASEMEDFIKANPKATQAQIDKEAVLIADSVDNRFGELNQDNLFWNKTMKQLSQLALLSPTWTLGTVNEIGGGIKDAMGVAPALLKGEGVSRRTAYLAGLAFNTGLMSAVYQYLKTGKTPEGPRDLMAPQTGGTDIISGQPERAMTPGYQKDVYAFGYDFPNHILDEAANKLNPAPVLAAENIRNKDFRGLPIADPNAPIFERLGQLGKYDLEQLLPISVGQFSKGRNKGSNIGLPERSMSVRPAPGYLTDPKRTEQMQTKYSTLDWKKSIKADARAKARQE
jgi:hypothetical protein